MDAYDTAQHAHFTSSFELPGMASRSKFVKVTLVRMTPSEHFIRWAEGKTSMMDPVIDNLVFRRNFT